ncbi:hypothetical protein PGT21_028748 [Puccinia graminis f. sp. tritici]|uniref:Uncharacterized protein n=1 Tax=Puccinia graminis f. sp. tritici TaxID=56615 RepID=A0A5B0P861_PUCGR|nr:hypothetical protein PGT21_028748 [Puccinia graminis f. sp. tritici]
MPIRRVSTSRHTNYPSIPESPSSAARKQPISLALSPSLTCLISFIILKVRLSACKESVAIKFYRLNSFPLLFNCSIHLNNTKETLIGYSQPRYNRCIPGIGLQAKALGTIFLYLDSSIFAKS